MSILRIANTSYAYQILITAGMYFSNEFLAYVGEDRDELGHGF
jgi:hypothetical protein